jgi:DNA invertase Pin-like site-specific DNA recombinase
MMNVYIYLRKSRKDIEEESKHGYDTLRRHREQLLALIKREGYNLAHKPFEEIVSGETIIERPQMQELLRRVENGDVDGVVVMDLDRLGRGDMLDQGLIDRAFRYSETLLITPSVTYDPTSEEWELIFGIKSLVGRGELKAITRRLQGGRKKSVTEGKSISKTPPYGYLRDENLILYPDPDREWIIKKIFEMSVHGQGRQYIAHELDKLGIDPPNNKRTNWSPSMITAILKNEVYKGDIVWGKFKHIKRHGKYSRRRTQPDEWIVKENAHTAIVSDELWNKANEAHSLRNRNTSVNIDKGLSNPLAGILMCANCGRSMLNTPRKNRRSSMLRCPNPACNVQRSSYLDIVEERLLFGLEDLVSRYKDAPVTKKKSEIPLKLKVIDKKETEKNELQEQKNSLHDYLEKRVYTIETFLERQNILVGKIEKVEKEIEGLKQEIKQEESQQKKVNEFLPTLIKVLDAYHHTEDIQKKNLLLKSVLFKVTYLRKKEWKLQDEFELQLYPKI